jgi:hypothetical protein
MTMHVMWGVRESELDGDVVLLDRATRLQDVDLDEP